MRNSVAAFIPIALLTAACGRHESEPFGFRDAGQVRRVAADATPEAKLREAIRSGDPAAVERELGAFDLNVAWSDGRTALIEAVISNRAGVVALLLSKGADPAVAGGDGLTALDHARERPAILRILAPPDAGAVAALFAAIAEGDTALVREKLEEGVDPNSADADGETCLTLALRARADGVVKTLLQDARTDANLKNRAGESPLTLARALGSRRAEQMLLSRGARE